MKRIRLALLLVSAVALGLVSLLAWRAHQGLIAERAVRHEAVAERTFEEMERALTSVLEREEGRPFDHYGFYVPSSLPGSTERSPLARAAEPFVVGAFQLDAQGALSTPLEPRDVELARARGHWPATPETQVAIERTRRVVNALWSANLEAEAPEDAAAPRLAEVRDTGAVEREQAQSSQAPGTTRALSGPGLDAPGEGQPARASAKKESRSAYDLLQSLNRSAEVRAGRKQKVARAPSAAVYGDSGDYALEQKSRRDADGAASSAEDDARDARANAAFRDAVDELAKNELGGSVAPAAPPGASLEEGFAVAETEAGARAERALRRTRETSIAGRQRGAQTVRITLDPMLGVAGEDDTLVLYRTVLVGERAFRQGLVLDRDALGRWLEEQVIGQSGLAEVARVRFSGASFRADDPQSYVFAHRFAEPFDALQAQLALAALPGVASSRPLVALVAVLLALGAAGLYAVHRMVSVALHFAERRSNFVAAVSHELKTPLTAIRMYAEMLRDGLVADEAKRQEYYGTITDESERLSRLVDNVLEFSKLENGTRDLAVSAGPLAPVLEEAIAKLEAHAAREGFTLSLDVEAGLPAVRFDRDALLQVLFNLVDNAMKYARASEPRRIEVSAHSAGEGVCVSVRDHGPGVARTHLSRIFEPFYRGESELTRDTKGTGIGLALVKELTERMNADVHGSNAEGGGFRVELAFPGSR